MLPTTTAPPPTVPPSHLNERDQANWLAEVDLTTVGMHQMANMSLPLNPFAGVTFEVPLAAVIRPNLVEYVLHRSASCPSPVDTASAVELPRQSRPSFCPHCHPLGATDGSDRMSRIRLGRVWLTVAERVGAAVVMTAARDLLLRHWDGGGDLTTADLVDLVDRLIGLYETNRPTASVAPAVDEDGRPHGVSPVVNDVLSGMYLTNEERTATYTLLKLAHEYQPPAVEAYRQVLAAFPLPVLRADYAPEQPATAGDPDRVWLLVRRVGHSWRLNDHAMVREWRIALAASDVVARSTFLELLELPFDVATSLFDGDNFDEGRWARPIPALERTAGPVLLETLREYDRSVTCLPSAGALRQAADAVAAALTA